MKRVTAMVTGLAGLLGLLAAPPAKAEPTAAQRATAEAVFQQATQLMDEQRFAEACEKFAASQELDPALGTQLYLADCYDRAGRSASAWALFREVQQRARRAGQPDRERIAGERASALESQLSRLELRVPASRRLQGLTLLAGGTAVPKASWNAPLPVDPGPLLIEARAPGMKPWSTRIVVAPGPARQTLELPQLQPALDTSLPATRATRQPGEQPSSAQHVTGLALAGAGVAALAVGGFFGYRAYARNKSSKGECRADAPNACTPEGDTLREQATDAARISTIVTLSGAALVLGGATLAITAPSRPARADTARLHRHGVDTGVQLELGGAW